MSKLLEQWRGNCWIEKAQDGRIRAWQRCGRCGGTGLTRFVHIHKGICFDCEGAKHRLLPKAAERVVLRAVGYPDPAKQIAAVSHVS